MKEFLPLGSIVVLKKGTKKIMIFPKVKPLCTKGFYLFKLNSSKN